MVMRRERTQNTNDVATLSSAIALNAATSTLIAAANPDRIFFSINMDCDLTTRCVFIKLQAASVDNDVKGILLQRDFSGNDAAYRAYWEMPSDTVYTGEISAITASATTDIFVTEY